MLKSTVSHSNFTIKGITTQEYCELLQPLVINWMISINSIKNNTPSYKLRWILPVNSLIFTMVMVIYYYRK